MYNTIRLEKGLYNLAGKTFTQALSEMDPDIAYADTEIRGLDAFERQLKRFDIKVSGPDCDTVEKFFATTESAVLFPEFVKRSVRAGMNSTGCGSPRNSNHTFRLTCKPREVRKNNHNLIRSYPPAEARCTCGYSQVNRRTDCKSRNSTGCKGS